MGVDGAPGIGFLLPNLLSTGPASLLLLLGLPKVLDTLISSLFSLFTGFLSFTFCSLPVR